MSQFDVPAVDAPETRVAVPQEEVAVNEKLAALATKIEDYKRLADYTPGDTFLSANPEVAKLQPLFIANQELKAHARLLWTELQDAKDRNRPEDRKALVEALEEDLADFEASFVVEVD